MYYFHWNCCFGCNQNFSIGMLRKEKHMERTLSDICLVEKHKSFFCWCLLLFISLDLFRLPVVSVSYYFVVCLLWEIALLVLVTSIVCAESTAIICVDDFKDFMSIACGEIFFLNIIPLIVLNEITISFISLSYLLFHVLLKVRFYCGKLIISCFFIC
jgi:hypothetical protein